MHDPLHLPLMKRLDIACSFHDYLFMSKNLILGNKKNHTWHVAYEIGVFFSNNGRHILLFFAEILINFYIMVAFS